ncbi:MAG: hypothetical protein M1832_000910 [Thelocarpon impressellum]|nr:MAG: hypothetical protein M1832_000910 [Thelocarpon impressellum]
MCIRDRLAAARGAARGLGAAAVEFRRWDVLRGDVSAVVEGGAVARRGGWDVVLDKGTFDAVSLSGERLAADDAGMAFEAYPARVARLVRPGGLVLVTSCNWTEEELARWFVRGGDGMLARHDRIAYPTFSFGGRKGQSVCTLVFRRVEEGS